jgi:hypothetical protein
VEEKQRQGLRISLCLPALNEEKTIGKEVVLFRVRADAPRCRCSTRSP